MRQLVRLLVLPLEGLALASTPAPAEDFTGFYAGVNAGYAFERSPRESGVGNSLPPTTHDDDGLPPSAAASALATPRDRPGAPGPRPR